MKKEYERFKGFSDVYDKSRPMLPREAIEILKKYKDTCTSISLDESRNGFKRGS